jgi:CRISPR/Cas system-associated protein Cas10 (large subunit of type III CRISPR-Cas system)
MMTNHGQTDPEFWTECNHLEDFERDAYHEGDAVKAALIQAVIDLKKQVEDLEKQVEDLEDVETLEQWECKHGPANQYREFFHECFKHLDGQYPCPSVTSDHDKRVIFDAITNGEQVRGEE